MKNKMVVIDCCTQCPNYFRYGHINGYECVLKYNNRIDDTKNIPAWCPLPDASLGAKE
jgi:hypothetical protein